MAGQSKDSFACEVGTVVLNLPLCCLMSRRRPAGDDEAVQQANRMPAEPNARERLSAYAKPGIVVGGDLDRGQRNPAGLAGPVDEDFQTAATDALISVETSSRTLT
jgi:hypothetical protein